MDPKWSMKCPFYHAVISSCVCYTHYELSNNLSICGSLCNKLANRKKKGCLLYILYNHGTVLIT